MLSRSEAQRIRYKKEQWDEALHGFNRFVERMKKEIKYNLNNWLDWYFGDAQEKNSVAKLLRRIGIFCVDIILLKLFGFI